MMKMQNTTYNALNISMTRDWYLSYLAIKRGGRIVF